VLRRLPHVDRVGVEERAATLGKRSIKTTAKQQGIRLAVSMLDLTTLEGADTPGKVRHLCAKAVCPAPLIPEIPSCAAVCVYPALVPVAVAALTGSGVATASVATGFPSGQVPLELKLRETEDAVAAGADEIDMVLAVGLLKSGDLKGVLEDLRAVRSAAEGRTLKVILETALLTRDEKITACLLAKDAGADFVKTSTGFASGGATEEDVKLLRQTVGAGMGVKASGGIRAPEQARALVAAGASRIGASVSVALVTPECGCKKTA